MNEPSLEAVPQIETPKPEREKCAKIPDKKHSTEVFITHPDTVAMAAELGARVRYMRRLFQYTMTEFARESQVSVHMMRKVEDGHQADFFVYFAAARVLRVPLKRLLEDKPERWVAWVGEFEKRQKGEYRRIRKEDAQ